MTKEDFYDWKASPVTQAVFASLREIEETIKETLATSAGVNPEQDREHVGYIKALRDFYLMKPEDTEEFPQV